jgi:Fe-S cluster assembly protein SufD
MSVIIIGEKNCEIITKIDQQGSYSVSNQFFTCEAGTDSQTVYQGMVNVAKTAKYAQVGIENVNLISGTDGKCQSVPEVYNQSDSAKIDTGTSTDLLDREKVYYLQTRGITQGAAEALIISTHRNQVLNIIQNPEIHEEVEQLLIG